MGCPLKKSIFLLQLEICLISPPARSWPGRCSAIHAFRLLLALRHAGAATAIMHKARLRNIIIFYSPQIYIARKYSFVSFFFSSAESAEAFPAWPRFWAGFSGVGVDL